VEASARCQWRFGGPTKGLVLARELEDEGGGWWCEAEGGVSNGYAAEVMGLMGSLDG